MRKDQWVHINMQCEGTITRSCLPVPEFISYIPTEIVASYLHGIRNDITYPFPAPSSPLAKEHFIDNLKDNWNQYSPKGKYALSIVEMSDKKITAANATADRLYIARYALENFEQPQPILDKISDKLFDHRYIFGGRSVELNTKESIDAAEKKMYQFHAEVLGINPPINNNRGRSR